MKNSIPVQGGAHADGLALSRRNVLIIGVGLTGTGFLAAGLGTRALWQLSARAKRAKALHKAAAPILTATARTDVEALPRAAGEQIKRYFDGLCLNAHNFTDEVCSLWFAEKLRACESDDHRHLLVNSAFGQHLASPIEISHQVDQIIGITADSLDRHWLTTCQKLNVAWDPILGQNGRAFAVPLETRLDPMIRQEIRRAQSLAHPLGEQPSVGGTILGIGWTALKLLPAAAFGLEIAVPAFVIAVLTPLWRLICGRISQRDHDFRTAVSAALAELADRVAKECEAAFQERIVQLESWRQSAVQKVSVQIASESFPLFS